MGPESASDLLLLRFVLPPFSIVSKTLKYNFVEPNFSIKEIKIEEIISYVLFFLSS